MNKVKHEIRTLNELEGELEELLSTVKPSDKLIVGDDFILEKDIYLPGREGISEGSIVLIKEIIKGGKGKTDEIKYIIKGGKGKIKLMSKWIFMGYFCKHLVSKEDDLQKQIDILKKHIKIERDKIKNKDVLNESTEVKEKVNFLLKIVKSISSALK